MRMDAQSKTVTRSWGSQSRSTPRRPAGASREARGRLTGFVSPPLSSLSSDGASPDARRARFAPEEARAMFLTALQDEAARLLERLPRAAATAHRHGGELYRRPDRGAAHARSRAPPDVVERGFVTLLQRGQESHASALPSRASPGPRRRQRAVARAMAEGALSALARRTSAVSVTRHCRPRRRRARPSPSASCIWPPRAEAGRRCTGNAASATSAATPVRAQVRRVPRSGPALAAWHRRQLAEPAH